ncbi:MAG: hypothetical protein LBQ66_11140 [Planctomycetaceae bacterium]|nr:hypothetical protein [Planctomycetaceae bacterium]
MWYNKGGTPAFQSVAASRQASATPTLDVLVLPMRVGDPIVGLRRRNRPAVGYPPYVCQHVLAFSSNLFGSITHRGGRDARVPVRRRFAANLCGITRC